MAMPPRLRRFVLLVHIVSSVGWMGAIAAFVVVAMQVRLAADPQVAGAGVLVLAALASWVLVPAAVLALISGIVVSLGGAWGLVRHYWVVFKLALTAAATAALLAYVDWDLAPAAVIARSRELDGATLVTLRDPVHLTHAGLALTVLSAVVVLAVYKPAGVTGWGRRRGGRVAAAVVR